MKIVRNLSKYRSFIDTEINILDSLPLHENIASVYCTHIDEDFAFILMEYCSGGELLDYVNERRLTLDESDLLLTQLTSAVKHLYDNNIMHQDLKLENILLDSQGNVKLIDFGLATRVQKGYPIVGRVGSMFYVAPEVLQRPSYTYNAELWSIGIVMYMATQNSHPFIPFDGENHVLDYITRYFKLHYSVEIKTDVSSEVHETIINCLIPSPEERWSMDEFFKTTPAENSLQFWSCCPRLRGFKSHQA